MYATLGPCRSAYNHDASSSPMCAVGLTSIIYERDDASLPLGPSFVFNTQGKVFSTLYSNTSFQTALSRLDIFHQYDSEGVVRSIKRSRRFAPEGGRRKYCLLKVESVPFIDHPCYCYEGCLHVYKTSCSSLFWHLSLNTCPQSSLLFAFLTVTVS